MNDVPKPQPKPLDLESHERNRKVDSPRLCSMSKLVVMAAIVTLFAGGVLWKNSSNLLADSSAGAGSATAQTPSSQMASQQHLITQLALLSPNQAASALTTSHFDDAQKQEILLAMRNRKIRLVQMPIAELAGAPGQAVTIESGGFKQVLLLKPELQSVALPILAAGEVSITPATPPTGTGLQTGILTALGPVILPTIRSANQQIVLDVIAQ